MMSDPKLNHAQPAGDGNTAELQIAMLIYPEMTAMDMVAPQLVFANLPNSRVHLVWKEMVPIVCDSGLTVLPTATLEQCPADLDVLFVGGSKAATWPLMHDKTIMDFLADRGARAQWVTSVCTGSLLLAAAGLLNGYQATSHWAVRHLLTALGAQPKEERVVSDRNRLTGGGITAGIDFALMLASKLCGPDFAQTLQLILEYDPEPPFPGGSPHHAAPAILQMAQNIYAQEVSLATLAVEQCRGARGHR